MPRRRSTYDDATLRWDVVRHHAALAKAVSKWGWRHGDLGGRELDAVLRGLRPDAAGSLAYANPYARVAWQDRLLAALAVCGLDRPPPRMVTVLHHPWHFAYRRHGDWRLDLPGIVAHAREAFAGLDYLLLVELALLTCYGHRYVAPHLHGLVFGELGRRRRERLAACFAGGLLGTKPLVAKKADRLAGALRYCVKPATHAETVFRRRDGRLVSPGRDLWLTERHFFWRHTRGLAWPDLTLAGGAGVRVLALAVRGP